MKMFMLSQMPLLDKATIDNEPISSVDLMERASQSVVDWLVGNFQLQPITIICGPGNNGGDGLAVARLLAQQQWPVSIVSYLNGSGSRSADAQTNYDRVVACGLNIVAISAADGLPHIADSIIIDALFGSGLNRPLNEQWSAIVEQLNSCNATIVSIDMPSGLGTEPMLGSFDRAIVCAAHTISFQCPKLAFMLCDVHKYVGNWHVTNIQLLPSAIAQTPSSISFADEVEMRNLIPLREKFSYKGTFGHALLIAGSRGMMGAAALSASACMRSGVGLLTVGIPNVGFDILQTYIPEAMAVETGERFFEKNVDISRYNAIAVGPGLGRNADTQTAVTNLLVACKNPIVIDADALFHLATIWHENPSFALAQNSITTPHIGEFDRLTHKHTSDYDRLQSAIALAQDRRIVVVLKGRYTAVISSCGQVWFNSTGHQSLATAGSGDVLTGIILSFLAQGLSPFDAARLAVFMHGLSAQAAASHIATPSVLASDIVEHISNAFNMCAER